MRNATPEQQRAIDMTSRDILVSAAAGSGKTAVLVERIIRLITDPVKPVDIDRLLVVTYTNAAAAEMRGRVLAAINKLLEASPGDKNLRRQSALIHNAPITTMHAFCLRTIRANFYMLGIDPAVRVADETECELMKTEILDEIFEELYSSEDNTSFLELVDWFCKGVTDHELSDVVLSLFGFVNSSPNPEAWLTERQNLQQIRSPEEFFNSGWYKFLIENAASDLDEAYRLAVKNCGLSADSGFSDMYRAALEQDLDIVENLKDSLKTNFNEFLSCLALAFPRMPAVKTDDDYVLRLKDRINANRERIKKTAKELKLVFLEKDISKQISDQNACAGITGMLCDVVLMLIRRFDEEKRKKNIVDFADFEHLCLKALLSLTETGDTAPSPAAIALRERFEEILIDEYQDINPVQELILSCISRKQENCPNRFMVGDIKQSIYRFRLADPRLFIQKYETYDGSRNEGPEKRIDLTKNFRSREPVLSCVNFLFAQLMSREFGDVDYDATAMLYAGAKYPDREADAFNGTEVFIIDAKKESPRILEDEDDSEEERPEDFVAEYENIVVEAKLTAAKIRELLDSEYPVTKDEKFVPVQPRDIVILLRSPGSTAEVFARELRNRDIGVFCESSKGFFEETEIQTAVSLLQIIDNPRQDIPLISVLFSPVFEFTPDELYEIRSKRAGKYYDCLEAASEGGGALAEKAGDFLSRLEKWREKAVFAPIHELIMFVYEDTGYYDLVSAMPGGKIRQANLNALFERAMKYEQTGGKSLFRFIRYIERLRSQNGDFGAANTASEDDNLVRIMSIHKSKGLEFPIVFCCGMGGKFNAKDYTKSVLPHIDYGVGLRHFDADNRIFSNTAQRTAISKKLRKEALSEELRVLYVALTRAKEKLVLIGTSRNLEKTVERFESVLDEPCRRIEPSLAFTGNSFLEWLIPCLMRHETAAFTLTDRQVYEYADSLRSEFALSVLSKEEALAGDIRERRQYQSVAEILDGIENHDYSGRKREIERALAYRYGDGSLSRTPSKLSISEIKRRFQLQYEDGGDELESAAFLPGASISETETYFPNPEFMSEKTPDAAAMGTALHSVLEHMDFENVTEDSIRGLIGNLRDRNILTEAEARLVPVHSLAEFSRSELFRRMQSASKLYREYPFILKITPERLGINENSAKIDNARFIVVNGVIDCLFEENGSLILVDYKTDRTTEESAGEIIERYRIQLTLYREAASKALGMTVSEAYIYLFSINKAYPVF